MSSPAAKIGIKTSGNVAACNFKYAATDPEFSLSRKRLAPLEDESPEEYAIKCVKVKGPEFTQHVTAERLILADCQKQNITLAQEVAELKKALQIAEFQKQTHKTELEKTKARVESEEKAHKDEIEHVKKTAESHIDSLKQDHESKLESQIADLKRGYYQDVISRVEKARAENKAEMEQTKSEWHIEAKARLDELVAAKDREAKEQVEELNAVKDEQFQDLHARHCRQMEANKKRLKNQCDKDVRIAEKAAIALQRKLYSLEEELCTEIAAKEVTITVQEAEIRDQDEKIRGKNVWITKLVDKIAPLEEEIATLKGTIQKQKDKIFEHEADIMNLVMLEDEAHRTKMSTENSRARQEKRAKQLQAEVNILKDHQDFGDITSMMDKSTVGNRKRRTLPGEDTRNAAKLKDAHQIGKSNGGISKPKSTAKTTTVKKIIREDSKEERSRKQSRRDENLGMDSMFFLPTPSPPTANDEIL